MSTTGMTMMKFGVLAAVAVAAISSGPAQAQESRVGDRQQCLRLQAVGQTPVIDDRTILVEMKGGAGYRRIDLVNTCPGLKIQGGFSFGTSTQDICTSTGLKVLDNGSNCMIKEIVTIDKAEAEALKARR
jgi:hypothetical protein